MALILPIEHRRVQCLKLQILPTKDYSLHVLLRLNKIWFYRRFYFCTSKSIGRLELGFSNVSIKWCNASN